jgi:K+-transporting ATPase ATPase B chain
MLDPRILRHALGDAFVKFDPRHMIKNPVMFVVEVGSLITTVVFLANPDMFVGLITVWLWVTVLFANVAEAVAEGRGKAQADAYAEHGRNPLPSCCGPDATAHSST